MLPRFQSGERLGDLLIEQELGQGAFAVVYLARDTRLDRQVALKVLAVSKLSDSAEDRARLLQEARLVARLQSPHIVPLYRVHDLGVAGLALEMEYMDGGSLADLLKARGRLAPDDAVAHLRCLLGALDVAHGQGIVHRDVKPENLLFSSRGELKLADFGLGRQLGEASLSTGEARSVEGTPLYMSPEVVGGERATPASDLWSAGVVLHRMLTGRLPFEPGNLPALFYAIYKEEPAPLGNEHPAGLARLVARCLEKDPERRPESARAMLRELSGPVPLPPRAPAPHAPLAPGEPPLGRDRELGVLTQALDRASQGAGGAVLLVGEAGAGKTTLLLETARRAEERSFSWIDVAMTPLGGLQRPLAASAKRVLGGAGGSGDWGSHVTAKRFGPAAATLRGLLADEVFEVQSRQQMVWAVEALLRGLAADGPVALAVEDAHFAGAEDLRVLGEIVRRLADARVCVLTAYRTHDATSSEGITPSAPALAELAATPGVVSLTVGPLPEEALRTLELREAQAERVAPEVRERVRHQTEGNALFAIELVRHMLAQKVVEVHGGRLERGPYWDHAALPQRLSELVSIRLQRLTEDQRSLLDAAAVDGVTFDGGSLAKVLNLNLLQTLRSLQQITREHGLLTPQPQGYRFSHAMFRDVIYRELAPDLKRHLHCAMAERLESDGAARGDHERVGTHWERAGEPDRAMPFLRQAALAAARRQDYTHALDLAERSGVAIDGPPALKDPLESDLRLALAGCLSDLGRPAEAEAHVSALEAAAREAGDDHLRLRAGVWRNDFALSVRGAESIDATALDEAATRLPDGYERGRAHYLLGDVALMRGEEAQAEERLRHADTIFLACGDRRAHAQVLHLLGDLARTRGATTLAISLLEESARIKDLLGRRTDAAVSRIVACITALQAGRLEGARAVLDAGVRELETTGAELRAAHASVFLAKVEVAEGNYEAAHAILLRSLRVLDGRDLIYGRLEALMEMAGLLVNTGRCEEAESMLREARVLAQQGQDIDAQAVVESLEVKRRLLAGDPAGARSALSEFERLLTGGLVKPLSRIETLGFVAQCEAYGLAAEGRLEALIDTAARADEPHARSVRAWLAAARALVDPRERGAALVAAAEEIRQTLPGWGRAEAVLLADWLEAEGRRHQGDSHGAEELRARVRTIAAKLPHPALVQLAS